MEKINARGQNQDQQPSRDRICRKWRIHYDGAGLDWQHAIVAHRVC
jgi:hypothetical protein